MKLDILAFGAHPDDVELCCGGTLLSHASMGYKTGIADLTRGEMGTRGTPTVRDKEAQVAARLLKASCRVNLGFADATFENDHEHRVAVAQVIRQYRPEIVLANAPSDRH